MARKRTKFPTKMPAKLGGGPATPVSRNPNASSNQSRYTNNEYGLSPKHFKFFTEYVREYDRTAAYKAAGYKGKNADAGSAYLLGRTDIRAAIKRWEDEQKEDAKAGVERVLEELGRIAFCDVRKFFYPDGRLKKITSLKDKEAAAISSINFSCDKAGNTYISSIKLCSKESALINYGKHLGMFKPSGDSLTDPEELAVKMKEAQEMMLQTLPVEQSNIIQGHFR